MYKIIVSFVLSFSFLRAICFEPSEPYCVDSKSTYQDESSFNRCRQELENYINDLNKYMRCVAEEGTKKAMV